MAYRRWFKRVLWVVLALLLLTLAVLAVYVNRSFPTQTAGQTARDIDVHSYGLCVAIAYAPLLLVRCYCLCAAIACEAIA